MRAMCAHRVQRGISIGERRRARRSRGRQQRNEARRGGVDPFSFTCSQMSYTDASPLPLNRSSPCSLSLKQIVSCGASTCATCHSSISPGKHMYHVNRISSSRSPCASVDPTSRRAHTCLDTRSKKKRAEPPVPCLTSPLTTPHRTLYPPHVGAVVLSLGLAHARRKSRAPRGRCRRVARGEGPTRECALTRT